MRPPMTKESFLSILESQRKSRLSIKSFCREEYYSLKSKARLAGISLSEYIRMAIKNNEVKQRLSPEHLGYIRQLSGMANNINQIARKANAAGYAETHRENRDMIDQLDNIVKQITE